jgi:chromate transporter
MGRIRDFFKNSIYLNLFLCFFKMGLFTIGGGMAMIPILQESICEKYKWLTEEETLDCIAVSQSLPGVIAINMATYVGYRKKGLMGAIFATVGVVLPSFVIIILVVSVLRTIEDNPYVQGALEGIKAAATGLVAFAAYKMAKQTLHNIFGYVMAVVSFVLIAVLGISAVWVILAGMVIGEVYFAISKTKEGGE